MQADAFRKIGAPESLIEVGEWKMTPTAIHQ
jgi:hypothetical protein